MLKFRLPEETDMGKIEPVPCLFLKLDRLPHGVFRLKKAPHFEYIGRARTKSEEALMKIKARIILMSVILLFIGSVLSGVD